MCYTRIYIYIYDMNLRLSREDMGGVTGGESDMLMM